MTAKKRYKTLPKGQDPISVLIGSEPVITGEDIEGQISNALNWYRNSPAKMYPKFIREYMDSQSHSKEEIARAIRGPKKAYEFFAVAVYGRMVVRGVVLPKSSEKKLKESVQYLLEKNPVKIEEASKVSVQDHIKEKANRLIFALEAEIDNYATALKSGKKHLYDLVEWFKKNEVKAIQAEYIHKHFEPRLEQITSAIDGSDEDMKEAYSWLSKPSLRKYADFYGEIITLAKEQITVAKTNRKPRKKKEKTPAQLVTKMVYAKEFVELSIKSVNPEEIIGASRVVVYNIKKQTIAVYNSSELSSGLSVVGTKIINYDIKTSTTKKVRDPKKSVQKFLGGLRAINNAFSEIKTKEKPVNGKVNQDCLIVQVITK
jgi:hypothetical protein